MELGWDRTVSSVCRLCDVRFKWMFRRCHTEEPTDRTTPYNPQMAMGMHAFEGERGGADYYNNKTQTSSQDLRFNFNRSDREINTALCM